MSDIVHESETVPQEEANDEKKDASDKPEDANPTELQADQHNTEKVAENNEVAKLENSTEIKLDSKENIEDSTAKMPAEAAADTAPILEVENKSPQMDTNKNLETTDNIKEKKEKLSSEQSSNLELLSDEEIEAAITSPKQSEEVSCEKLSNLELLSDEEIEAPITSPKRSEEVSCEKLSNLELLSDEEIEAAIISPKRSEEVSCEKLSNLELLSDEEIEAAPTSPKQRKLSADSKKQDDITDAIMELSDDEELPAKAPAEPSSSTANEVQKPIEPNDVSENVELMDTTDSQESSNLIIDEAGLDDSVEQSENPVADIEMTDKSEPEKSKVIVTSAESLEKNESQIENQIANVDQDKDDALITDQQSDTVPETKAENKDEGNQASLNDDKATNVVPTETPAAVTDQKAESKDEPQVQATVISDEAKDDDVVAIEQPAVPIIEIDDDDDEEDASVVVVAKTESSSQESNTKDQTNNEPSTSNIQSSNSLLNVASEKTIDEVIKDEEVEKKQAENQLEDTTNEVFYNKECINHECPHKHKQYFKVPHFAFSYFKVTKKKFKVQYICAECYDLALDMFENFCNLLNTKQPLLMHDIPSGRQEFVEIIDSSDEEDASDSKKQAVVKPNSSFSKKDLSLIETELANTIKSVLNRVEIQNQLTWSKTILTERLKNLEMETQYVDNELKSLQKKADKMHEGLYSCPKIKIRQLQPLDLNSGKVMPMEVTPEPIPPVGDVERPPIQINGVYYAVKNNAIASWVPCKVSELIESSVKNVVLYKIRYLRTNQHQPWKNVPAKYLAYYEPPAVRMPIGTRVIAYFDATSLSRGKEKMNVLSAFYPGIIAEPLKPNNKFRYLIFYDDGYTQYVYHKDIRLVCHVSENVWEDVHPASRDFIQKYLTQYSINRPMVQTQKGQTMNTESNGYWLHARVVDIDCSLVLMQFEGSKSHTEWIYRGSLRLGPVFKEYQKTLQKNSSMPVSRLPRRTEPFIRYTEDEDFSNQQQQKHEQQQKQHAETNRAVARKTFGRPESMMNQNSSQSSQSQPAQPTVKHLNNSTIYVEDENKPKGKVVYYTAKRNLPPLKYRPHNCSPSCLFEITHNLSAYSPLSKPLLSGWERPIYRQKIKKTVTYRAPCGKILRNMKELHHYLRITNNVLNVDNFDFSHETNCLAEYVNESAIVQKRDISFGQEKMAIPLVNYYDNTLPPECKYSAKVIPTEGVHINTDPAFLAGCDCEDDCSDKSKCSCWQLTLAGAKYGNANLSLEEVGYQYKRLLNHVPTGIYECNPNCKCKKNCLNRVVQHSLTMKLQVFKTSNRGWGLRSINDIPCGTFVCVYAGHLLTEAKANEGGQDAGDEYFAELDYIEVAEQIKEGYESEVEYPEPYDDDPNSKDDDEFNPGKTFLARNRKEKATRLSRSNTQEEDSQERQVINFNPNADMNEDSLRENSIRTLYGKDEACYVMDAKISGNLGRYFNHSCAPNMFVQNVFVDTHDLRFPWVAFFSSQNIRAGTELTWNYNYEVGVVPGKVLYCQCGAANCRLRLL